MVQPRLRALEALDRGLVRQGRRAGGLIQRGRVTGALRRRDTASIRVSTHPAGQCGYV